MSKNPPPPPIIPLQSFYWSEWDSVGRVKSAIRALEGGVFTMAAQVCDAMLRDDRVSGCMLARTEALPSLPRKIEPAKEDKRLEEIAIDLDARFDRMFPAPCLAELQKWGLMLGVGLAQNIWTEVDGQWEPHLEVWHPQFLTWREQTRSLWVNAKGGEFEVRPGDPRWVLYTPYGTERPWMGGLVRSLYVPWLIRQFGMRDWGRWSEAYGSPTKVAKFPSTESMPGERQRFVREIARVGNEVVVGAPQGATEQESYNVELLEANGTGYQGFDLMLAAQGTNIAVRILGQNLTTEVQGGSFAAAAVHGNIRNDILKGDAASLASCLSSQPVRDWVRINHGEPDLLAPKLGWHTAPPEDKKSGADAIASLGTSIKALSDLGVPVDTDALAKRFNVPLREDATDDDRKIAGQIYAYHLEAGVVTVNEVRQRLGLDPLPGAEGNELVKSAPPPQPMPGRGADDEDEDAPPAKRPPRGKNPFAKASKKSDGPDPLIVGQLHTDALADQAAKDGAQAIKSDVLALLSAINGATSYDEIRDRLAAVISDPTELAIVLERALVLAELNARLSVIEGL